MTKRWITVIGLLAALVGVTGLALHGAAVLAQGPTGPGPVVYASDRAGNYEIYVLDPNTGLTTQLTNNPATDIEPVWSPDGATVVFVSDRDGDFELFAVRADGTDLQQLTANNADERLPRWQPDGEHIIYHSNVNGQWDLYAVSADGALVRQLTNDPSDERGPGFADEGEPGVAPPPTVEPVASPTSELPDGVIDISQLNVRANPGTGAEVLTYLTRNTPVDIIGRYADNSWLQIQLPDGRQGWVSGRYVRVNIDLLTIPVVNAAFIAPPPTPTNTPIPTTAPPPAVVIEFWASATTITAGDCVTLYWRVEGIESVYYQGTGVVGEGSSEECPASTTTYQLVVNKLDGTSVTRTITVVVNP